MTMRYSLLSQAIALVASVLISAFGPSAVSAAETQRIEESGTFGNSWPVSSDGRLLFDIFGRQVALSACAECKIYTEFRTHSRTAEPRYFSVRLDRAIEKPAPLRRALSSADEVSILTATVPKSGLLFDRLAQPEFNRFTITFFRKPSKGHCQYWSPWIETSCESLVRHATEVGSADPNGFVSIETFAGIGGATVFIPVAERLRAMTGVPPFIICVRYASPWCENSENLDGEPGSFFLAADLAVGFQFNRRTVLESEWMSLFEKARSVVESVVSQQSISSH